MTMELMTQIETTYLKRLDNGQYEYGYVEIHRENRRKDRLVMIGTAPDYDEGGRRSFRLAVLSLPISPEDAAWVATGERVTDEMLRNADRRVA